VAVAVGIASRVGLAALAEAALEILSKAGLLARLVRATLEQPEQALALAAVAAEQERRV
jgi:hypothetical protein